MTIEERITKLDPLVRKMASSRGRGEDEAIVAVRQVMLGLERGTQVTWWEMLARDYGITMKKLEEFGAELSYPDQLMLHAELGKNKQAMEALERYLVETYGPVFTVVLHSAGLDKGGGTHGTFFSEEEARAEAKRLADKHGAPCRICDVYRSVLLEPPILPSEEAESRRRAQEHGVAEPGTL